MGHWEGVGEGGTGRKRVCKHGWESRPVPLQKGNTPPTGAPVRVVMRFDCRPCSLNSWKADDEKCDDWSGTSLYKCKATMRHREQRDLQEIRGWVWAAWGASAHRPGPWSIEVGPIMASLLRQRSIRSCPGLEGDPPVPHSGNEVGQRISLFENLVRGVWVRFPFRPGLGGRAQG